MRRTEGELIKSIKQGGSQMPQVPFSVTTDYMHATAEGCVRVVAVPHIMIYRIPHA